MGQWSHGICPSADNPAPPPAFLLPPGLQWNPRGPSNPGHRTLPVSMVTYGPSIPAKSPKDQRLHPWPCWTQCILRIPVSYQNTRMQEFGELGSGLNFTNGNNGKGSRAESAHAAKHTCLSGCWNASVLGGIPGHAALLPREQLSATGLCVSCPPVGTFVRTMGAIRHPAEKPLPRYPTHLLYPNQKDTGPTSSLHLGRRHFGWYRVMIPHVSPVSP